MTNKRYWSGKVTEENNALDLEEGIFTRDNPEKIARSFLKKTKLDTKQIL